MQLQMQNIEEAIREILHEAKEIEAQRDALDKKMLENDRKAGKICYLFYKEFLRKNWDTLDRNTEYYQIYIGTKLAVQMVVYDSKYERFAIFHPVNNSRVNIYVYKDTTEEEYEVGKVIIDKDQLNWFSERFNLSFLNYKWA